MSTSKLPWLHKSPGSTDGDDRFVTGLFLGAALALLAGGTWAISLIIQPGAGYQVLAFSLLSTSVVGSLGLVLSRGRWSRRLTQITMLSLMVLPGITRPGWWLVASSLAAAALVVVSTPWGQEGLRKLPPAEPIPDQAILLSLGLLGLPAVAAVGQLDSAGIGLTAWAAAVLAMAALYSRAQAIGLWSARLILGAITIPIVFTSPLPAALVTAAGTAALVAVSWHPQALVAITDAAPRPVTPVPVPPELIPEDLMKAAGYDSSGRPLKRRT